MSFDKKIRQELEAQTQQIEETINDREGIIDLAIGSFKGGLARWMLIANVVTLINTGFLIWSCFEFCTAVDLDSRVFWGAWFVITMCLQIGLKQWIWMEMNRNSVLREIKRMEVAVQKLSANSRA